MIGVTAKSLIAATLVCGGSAGFLYWHANHKPLKVATNAVVVDDVSLSVDDGNTDVVGIAEIFFAKPNLTRGSVITIMATGDDKTVGEPRLVGTYDVPFSRRALEGKGSLAIRKKEVLAEIKDKLLEIPRTERSPIFLGAKRGIEKLRATGCESESNCYLFVRTDGEELSERAIKTAIDGNGKVKGLPAALANEGITVTFCGLAETSNTDGDPRKRHTTHTAKRIDRIRDVWSSVFTVSDKVNFDPYCPKSRMNTIAEK